MDAATGTTGASKNKRRREAVAGSTSLQEKYAAKRQSRPVVPGADGSNGVLKSQQRTEKKGLQSFRARKEAKRLQTAKQLRSYQRACKREGYEPGVGASRKRTERTSSSTTATSNEVDVDHDDQADLEVASTAAAAGVASDKPEQSTVAATAAAASRPDRQPQKQPYKKQHQKAAVPSAQERIIQEERAAAQQKQDAMRKRRDRHKLLTARTKRGQPIMKNLVQDILNQLQSQAQKQPQQQQPEAKPK